MQGICLIMTTISEREAFVANFEAALRKAGMQSSRGKDAEKPKYWRDQVKETEKSLYLVYSVPDSPEAVAADNKPYLRTIYAYGTVFTRNGRNDEDYQLLLADIQTVCKTVVPKITMLLGGEGADTSIDPDSPIDYINFTAYQKRLV